MQISGQYHGEGSTLFWLYAKTAALTLLTLGIYRFWAKTRVRQYVWSAVEADGDSFEYTGTGLEKLLGFLVAVVILAIFLGTLQLILSFVGLSLPLSTAPSEYDPLQLGAVYLAAVAVVPLMLFAQYRARRYKMSRTRWRGLRFGMENGAWGYAGRALAYYALALLSLGVLWPLLTYRLEKYMTDRTWFGDARFEQTGRWQALYGGFRHILIGMAIIGGGIFMAFTGPFPILAGVALPVGWVWFLCGFVYYRVFAFNYLAEHKLLDGAVAFQSGARPAKIVKTAVLGSVAASILGGVILSATGWIVTSAVLEAAKAGGAPSAGVFLSSVLGYVLALLVFGGLMMVLVTQPILRHVVKNMTILNASHLDEIRQRSADAGADAEGFADALDVGGAL